MEARIQRRVPLRHDGLQPDLGVRQRDGVAVMNRRGILGGLVGLLVAPAIVRAEGIMRVKPLILPSDGGWAVPPDLHSGVMEIWQGRQVFYSINQAVWWVDRVGVTDQQLFEAGQRPTNPARPGLSVRGG